MTDEAEKEIARLRTIIDCYAASSAAAAAELKRLRADAKTNTPTTVPAADGPTSGAAVAWAVVSDSLEEIDCEFIYPDEATAGDVALDINGGVVPLYRQPQPTLTDEEREAVKSAIWDYEQNDDDDGCASMVATLRGLLERLGGKA